MTVLLKTYTNLPEYADVAYVDGKLEVARLCLKAATTSNKRNDWLETIDILLAQRSALSSLEEAQQ